MKHVKQFYYSGIEIARRSTNRVLDFISDRIDAHIAKGSHYPDPAFWEYVADRSEAEKAVERELLCRYPDASSNARLLDARAQGHGVVFSDAALPHHRAAILDHLDNPETPTILTPSQLTWVGAEPGHPDWEYTHHKLALSYARKNVEWADYPRDSSANNAPHNESQGGFDWRTEIREHEAVMRRSQRKRARLELH